MDEMRKTISSGSPLEPVIGFSRAVRAGNLVCVSGTAPIGSDGATIGPGDAQLQAARCFEIVAAALAEAGAGLEHVVRTRILLTNISDWPAVAAVHGRIFGAIRPACTVCQVQRFIDPAWLVEIEVDAYLDRPA